MANNNISILIEAKDQASAVLKSIGSEMANTARSSSGLSDSFARVRDVALGVYLPQLASKFIDLGKSAIQGAGDFEQSRVAFETMLGSADKARTLLEQISKFAKETPFELPEVVAGSKQLLAFGFSADQVIPTMRKLGDIASGVGIPVGQLAYVFGQVRVAGKLMGGDLMQFTNAGVPMIEGLSKVLHVSQSEVKSMVEQGKVGFSEVEQVINNMTGAGSQFGGMMEKQSHTFGGVVSNIKDGFSQILRSAVGVTNAGDIVKGGLFDKLKSGAEALMPVMQRLGDEAGPAVSRAMKELGQEIRSLVTSFKDPDITSSGFHGFLEQIGSAARVVTDAFKKYLLPSLTVLGRTVTTSLGPSLKQLLPYLDDIAKLVGGALVGALWLAINAINFFIKSLGFWIDLFFEVKKTVGDTVDWISQRFNEIVAVFQAVYDGAAQIMSALFTAVVMPVVDAIVAIAQTIAAPWIYAFEVIRGAALVAWWWIYNSAVKPVMDAIGLAAGFMGAVLDLTWQAIDSAAGKAWASVSGKAVRAWQDIYGVWAAVDKWFDSVWNRVSGSADKASGSVGKSFARVAEDVKGAFKEAINWIIDRINGLAHGLNSTVGKLPGVQKIGDIPHFASGTDFAPGGISLVGERGPELVNLPRGSQVYPADKSQQMLSSQPSITYVGPFYFQTAESVRAIFALQDRNSQLAAMGGSVVRP